MILEIAQIEVKAGMEPAFEEGVTKAAPIFQRAKGCKGMELQRSLEQPARYRLFVRWQALENHTVDFRGSADFQECASSSGIASSARPRSSTRGSPCTASGASADKARAILSVGHRGRVDDAAGERRCAEKQGRGELVRGDALR